MYLIATYRIFPDGNIDDARFPGIFRHWEAAHNRVMDNSCDIFEDGYYNYACVIKPKENELYPQTDEIQWYHYGDDGSVTTISRPEEAPRNLPGAIC